MKNLKKVFQNVRKETPFMIFNAEKPIIPKSGTLIILKIEVFKTASECTYITYALLEYRSLS